MGWGPSPTTTVISPSDAGPNDPSIILFPDPIPQAIIDFYAPDTVIACIKMQQGANDFIAFVWVDPIVGRSFCDIGGMESVGLLYTPAVRFRPTAGAGEFTDFTILTNNYVIDGKDAPRSLLDRVDSNANTGAIGAETITLTSNAVTFKNGFAYKCRVGQHLFGSIANQAEVRVKQTNLAGNTLMFKRTPVLPAAAGGAPAYDYENVFVNTRGSDFTGVVVASLLALAGTVTGAVGGASTPRVLEVWCVGAAADFPLAPSLV